MRREDHPDGAGHPIRAPGCRPGLYTVPTAIRRALEHRDGGCAFPGCGRPVRWCDAHHVRAWSRLGKTALHNLVLLCRLHHRMIHAGEWTVAILDGQPTFTPPP
ncbi:HNH endonuclease signature motif containing protein [Kutzneria viridogrisea]|uniref:HNH endonuclease signature motif containing protein n=1 Tax=Kutzneria viridogrisea TaxID=47990 RepID=UPI00398C9AD6